VMVEEKGKMLARAYPSKWHGICEYSKRLSSCLICICWFSSFGGTRSWTQGLVLARRLSHSTPDLFVLVIFEIRSHFMPMTVWTRIFLFMLPCTPGMTVPCHKLNCWLKWGLANFLPRLTSSLNSFELCLLSN
jgi:hypothetical protein